MNESEKTLWEIRNEKNKASVRWLLIGLICGWLSYLLYSGKSVQIGPQDLFNWYYVGILSISVICINLLVTLLVHSARKSEKFHPIVKYATMITDLLTVAFVLIPTGGSESMFFVINYVIIVSNGLRYGMRVAIVGTIAFNVFYVGVLGYQYYPSEDIANAQNEILKVAGFWLVGIYTGYLSRRFQILQGEVEKYQKLLANMMQGKTNV